MPSNALNQQFKTQITDFEQKLGQATSTDAQLNERFNVSKEQLQLLTKTKAELEAQIPSSPERQGLAENPAIVAIKQAIEGLEGLKEKRIEYFKEQDEKIKAHSAIDELMAVNSGNKEKG